MINDNDIIVITKPKSGTNWISSMDKYDGRIIRFNGTNHYEGGKRFTLDSFSFNEYQGHFRRALYDEEIAYCGGVYNIKYLKADSRYEVYIDPYSMKKSSDLEFQDPVIMSQTKKKSGLFIV